MRTRRYTFKASGTVNDPVTAAALMKDNMNKGPQSVIQRLYGEYFHHDDRDTVDRVGFVMDGGQLSAVEVSTYDWFQKNRKNEIRECVQMAADRAGRETGSKISIDAGMKYVATDENLPEHFYHLTERKSLDAIMEEGLAPKRGHNDWKSKKRCTYLTEAQYIAPWLGILEKMEDPVVLEVDTSKLTFVEQGRIWEDREYVPGRVYSEHRTTEPVPPEALRVMVPEEVAALGVNDVAVAQLMYVAAHEPDAWVGPGEKVRSHEKEVKRCMDRLVQMGVMSEPAHAKAMEDYEGTCAAVDFAEFAEKVNAIKGPEPWGVELPFE